MTVGGGGRLLQPAGTYCSLPLLSGIEETLRGARDTHVRSCARYQTHYCNNVSATASHYTELPLFSRGHGFLHFRRGQRRRENVAKTSRIRLCLNGIPPRGKQLPAFVRSFLKTSLILLLFLRTRFFYLFLRDFSENFSSLSLTLETRVDHRHFALPRHFPLVVERVIQSDVCSLS